MLEKIRVGLVGVTPGHDFRSAGWSYVTHLPALKALPDYELQAICSRSRDSAVTAARDFDIPLVLDDVESMVHCDVVDLVVVTVRVAAHLRIVETALDAGKRVFCEWPLGNGLAETERIAAHARRCGLHCGVGLQARAAPSVNFIRDLVAAGYVGEILSTSMIGAGMNWGPGMPTRNAYTLDKANGATLLSIPTGHALDALCYCLGEFTSVTATSGLRRQSIALSDRSAPLPMSAEDQWAITGTLESGAVASVHFRGGFVHAPAFLWEINGSAGDLRMTSDFGNAQVFQLSIQGAAHGEPLQNLPIPASYFRLPDLKDPVLNVAELYARYAADRRDRGHRCPTFDDAVTRHRLLQSIQIAASTGLRQDGATR